ncbi:toxin-antitoxin system HicB family antitoxin [Pseudonocardia sp. TRM90224]|uniref:toxin-antitoxin system HicB family antitoxin n=1 Tax=Pseudonocardia sp. TRM90224 TaxID=2812678 RepID=UPI001E4618B5|nr:toxin-antitoxin system HicB family antitoxin [Pseudonocardia sp. TRM90224]
MDLGSYVESIRRELAVAAESGDDESRALAERLIASVGSAVRLALLEALAAAADEITRELAPGSVHMTLRGREPGFVVVVPPADNQEASSPAAELPTPPSPPEAMDGATSRINFRPPENLKTRIEEAAAKEGLSVNAWLVRATSAALDPGQQRDRRPPRASGGRFTGWVG